MIVNLSSYLIIFLIVVKLSYFIIFLSSYKMSFTQFKSASMYVTSSIDTIIIIFISISLQYQRNALIEEAYLH